MEEKKNRKQGGKRTGTQIHCFNPTNHFITTQQNSQVDTNPKNNTHNQLQHKDMKRRQESWILVNGPITLVKVPLESTGWLTTIIISKPNPFKGKRRATIEVINPFNTSLSWLFDAQNVSEDDGLTLDNESLQSAGNSHPLPLIVGQKKTTSN